MDDLFGLRDNPKGGARGVAILAAKERLKKAYGAWYAEKTGMPIKGQTYTMPSGKTVLVLGHDDDVPGYYLICDPYDPDSPHVNPSVDTLPVGPVGVMYHRPTAEMADRVAADPLKEMLAQERLLKEWMEGDGASLVEEAMEEARRVAASFERGLKAGLDG